MGAAKRFDPTSPCLPADDDPEVDVGFEWLGEEETQPWCVDDGSRIIVMRTREIQRGLGGGTLAFRWLRRLDRELQPYNSGPARRRHRVCRAFCADPSPWNPARGTVKKPLARPALCG